MEPASARYLTQCADSDSHTPIAVDLSRAIRVETGGLHGVKAYVQCPLAADRGTGPDRTPPITSAKLAITTLATERKLSRHHVEPVW